MQKIETTESFQILKNCLALKIGYDFIQNLNYLDLQNLIIISKIDEVTQIFTQLRKNKLNKKGIKEVIEASASDYENL